MRRFGLQRLFLTLTALGLFNLAVAQTQDSYDYNTEFIWGINKNSSGGLIGGFVFKKSRKLNDRLLETFGLEIMNVKHSQEVRQASVVGNYFIFGKSNYLYAFRFQYGRDFILFDKAPQQGVEIRAVTAIGPSIGIVAPYYIERKVDNSCNAPRTIRSKEPEPLFRQHSWDGQPFRRLGGVHHSNGH